MSIYAWDVNEIPAETGVYSATVTLTKAAVTTDTNVLIFSIDIFNPDADDGYLLVYDAQAGDVTVGTTTPTFIVGAGTKKSGPFALSKPIRFKNGLTVAAADAAAGTGAHNLQTVITYASSS